MKLFVIWLSLVTSLPAPADSNARDISREARRARLHQELLTAQTRLQLRAKVVVAELWRERLRFDIAAMKLTGAVANVEPGTTFLGLGVGAGWAALAAGGGVALDRAAFGELDSKVKQAHRELARISTKIKTERAQWRSWGFDPQTPEVVAKRAAAQARVAELRAERVEHLKSIRRMKIDAPWPQRLARGARLTMLWVGVPVLLAQAGLSYVDLVFRPARIVKLERGLTRFIDDANEALAAFD